MYSLVSLCVSNQKQWTQQSRIVLDQKLKTQACMILTITFLLQINLEGFQDKFKLTTDVFLCLCLMFLLDEEDEWDPSAASNQISK